MKSQSASLKSQVGKTAKVNIVSWTQTAPKEEILLLDLCLTKAPVLNHLSFKRTLFNALNSTNPLTDPQPLHFCPCLPSCLSLSCWYFILIPLQLFSDLLFIIIHSLFLLSVAPPPTGGSLFPSVINKTWAREHLLRIYYLPWDKIRSKSKSVWAFIWWRDQNWNLDLSDSKATISCHPILSLI